MSPLTVYLARFFGVSLLLLCAALAARPKASIAAATEIAQRPGLLLVTGVFTLAGGVACVLGHNIWSGGVLPIAVTALGWITLLKGLALLVTPPEGLMALYHALHYPQTFRLVMAAGAIAGAALTYLAFTA
jgi:hypothetical protein